MNTAVLIVSAFGRGHALAMELAGKEVPVCLVDVSAQLGLTSPEEWEGPFGLSLSGLNSIQQERLVEDDPIVRQSEGLTVLLPSGPLEFRGPLADHRLEKLKISRDARDLLHINRISATERERLLAASFYETWPVFLLRAYSANYFGSISELLESDLIYRADSEFAIRQATRLGIQKSLDACGRRLVNVKKPGVVKDITSVQGKRNKIRALEYAETGAASTEIIEYETLVWCLSSEETHYMSPAIAAKIFPKGIIKPDWYWTKFRFRMAPCVERDSLPEHSIWVGDVDLPWVHENFLIVQRTATPELFDVWAKLPYSKRFQKFFLQEQGALIARRMSVQSEALQPELHEEPTTAYQSYEQTGPTRFPVFGNVNPASSPQHILFHNPETWPGLGWASVFAHDQLLIEKIETWWNRKLQEKLKQAAKENRTEA